MDELTVAAAAMAMAVDDGAEAESAHNSTAGAVEAAEVLQSIETNTGEPLSPDPPSRIPPTVRGDHSSHDFAARLTLFFPGRDRR